MIKANQFKLKLHKTQTLKLWEKYVLGSQQLLQNMYKKFMNKFIKETFV